MKYLLVFMLIMLCGCSRHTATVYPPLQTVERVDLNRYLGEWHEIARYPNSFQQGCLSSSAVYSLRADGDIRVVNSCRDKDSGELRTAVGRAWVVAPPDNSRLKVSFFWPFRGDYWIIALGPDYEYAVVGTPDRQYLWILSRTPLMQPALYDSLIKNTEKQGFDKHKVMLSR